MPNEPRNRPLGLRCACGHKALLCVAYGGAKFRVTCGLPRAFKESHPELLGRCTPDTPWFPSSKAAIQLWRVTKALSKDL